MPARKRPVPEDAVTARQILLAGLARDADIFELVSELAPLHPRDNTFPGEVFLRLAADALDWCGPAGPTRCPWRDYASGSCPRPPSAAGRTPSSSTQCWPQRPLHGGTEPDLLDEVAWWQADDFWQYALFAAVACIRAAASRAGVPVRQVCQDLTQSPGHPAP